nr:PREDICTED: uncharacterized protein LOC109641015 [Paralichthys olivaceus]XP_019960879.1 PREDICTED: uncharacterized protein LOC109641015 [Paralichthys olivaceus]
MKCFERLVMQHITSILPPSLDPYQFAYQANWSTDDAISTAIHSALTHLDTKDSYMRMLFLDFSSAFNTIIPQQLIQKLDCLGLNTSLCNWLLDFLTGRPQAVRVGSNASSTITMNTGAPHGCMHSPFSLSLYVEKTKEIVVDFRRTSTQHPPLTINGAAVERVSSTKFLGVHISEDLSWSSNTASLAKTAQQCLYFLRRLRRARSPVPIMHTFYRGTTESIVTSCIAV